MVALVAIQFAQIEQLRLACRGELRTPSGVNKRDILTVTIRSQTGTVTVDGYAPVPITSDPGDDTVTFLAGSKVESGVTLGFFKRLTREISVHFITSEGKSRVFSGTCRRAERL